MIQIMLPRLNVLVPTIESTFRKLVEEQGELCESILEWQQVQGTAQARDALHNVAAELIDVAQTCISLTFAFEQESNEFDLRLLLDEHVAKLRRKNYLDEKEWTDHILFETTENGYRVMSLPRLTIPGVTMDSTVLNISMAIGRFAQWIGKFSGASGEVAVRTTEEIQQGCGKNLLHIAQCCFTLLYFLEGTFLVDTDRLLKNHIIKLQQKGYTA